MSKCSKLSALNQVMGESHASHMVSFLKSHNMDLQYALLESNLLVTIKCWIGIVFLTTLGTYNEDFTIFLISLG